MTKSTPINLHVDKDSYECTLAVECAVFGFQDNRLKLLLVKRSIDPFSGRWLLPGGIMLENQSLEQAADNILYSLTDIDNVHHEEVGTYSRVDRHPVKRVVSICFYALIKPENHPVIAKKHVSDVQWFPIDSLPDLAFDHNQMAEDALRKLRGNLDEELLLSELLPERFTLKDLQDLYESILAESLDRRNFRKKMLQTGLLEGTGEKKEAKGGPELFRWKC